MDFYTRNRAGNWVLIILVVLNLALLATIWYPRLNPPQKEIQREQKKPDDDKRYRKDEENRKQRDKNLVGFLRRELNFTQEQVDKFMQLRDEHFQKTRQLRRQVDDLRREMMELLLDDQLDSSRVEQFVEKMGQKTTELEKTVFYHFVELMKVCDSEQKSKYKTLLREILNQLKPPDHRPPPESRASGTARRPAGSDKAPEERRAPPLRDERVGLNHGERHFRRLRDQLHLTDSQAAKIQPLVETAFQELEKIPYDSQYRDHEERRKAMEKVQQRLDRQIETLLTGQQKKQYAEIKEERRRRPPPPDFN